MDIKIRNIHYTTDWNTALTLGFLEIFLTARKPITVLVSQSSSWSRYSGDTGTETPKYLSLALVINKIKTSTQSNEVWTLAFLKQ